MLMSQLQANARSDSNVLDIMHDASCNANDVICVPWCSFCIIDGAVLLLGQETCLGVDLGLSLPDEKQSYRKQCIMEGP